MFEPKRQFEQEFFVIDHEYEDYDSRFISTIYD